jgi:hypothetical protein
MGRLPSVFIRSCEIMNPIGFIEQKRGVEGMLGRDHDVGETAILLEASANHQNRS